MGNFQQSCFQKVFARKHRQVVTQQFQVWSQHKKLILLSQQFMQTNNSLAFSGKSNPPNSQKRVKFKFHLDDQICSPLKRPYGNELTPRSEPAKKSLRNRLDGVQSPQKINSQTTLLHPPSLQKISAQDQVQLFKVRSFCGNQHRQSCIVSQKLPQTHNLSNPEESIFNGFNSNEQIAATPNPDYGFDKLAHSNSKLAAIFSHNNNFQIEQLRKQVLRKNDEIDLMKAKHCHERRLLNEQIETLDQCNKQTERVNAQLVVIVKSQENKIAGLQNELRLSKQRMVPKLRARESSHQLPSTSGTLEKRKNSARICRQRQQAECKCHEYKQELMRLQRQLRRAEGINLQFHGVICNLHLTNKMYRQQLDSCGQSKTREFSDAERRLIQKIQKNVANKAQNRSAQASQKLVLPQIPGGIRVQKLTINNRVILKHTFSIQHEAMSDVKLRGLPKRLNTLEPHSNEKRPKISQEHCLERLPTMNKIRNGIQHKKYVKTSKQAEASISKQQWSLSPWQHTSVKKSEQNKNILKIQLKQLQSFLPKVSSSANVSMHFLNDLQDQFDIVTHG